MRVARSPEELSAAGPEGVVLTLGNFDGVHLGHKAVLAETMASALGRGAASVVVTFDPHPMSVTRPGSGPLLLTPTNEKLALLSPTGVDACLVLDFTPEVAREDAATFLRSLGVGKGSHLVLGYDFQMGRDRECDLAKLSDMGSEFGFGLDVVPPVLHESIPISSSRIRESVRGGEVAEAGTMLGRPYALNGRVVRGEALGEKLGFPTANVNTPDDKLLPADGVYLVSVESVGERPGLLYVGSRPTFGKGTRRIEVHVIDFSSDLYGAELRVSVLRRIRADRRFGSVEELRRQMEQDLAAAREMAARSR
jgi:riboflavin kinase / FMN adenylyltransferase